MRRLGGLPAIAAASVAAGCGTASHAGGAATARAPAGPIPVGAPLLAASSLPGLHAVTHRLGAKGVVLATPVQGLRSRLSAWGFRAAREREFTGRAHRLSHVVSLGVDFTGAGGAAAYERALLTQTAAYAGAGATITRISAAPDPSWVIRAQACGCHPTPPTVIAVVRRRAQLSWLSVTGPGATPARVRGLAARLTSKQSQPL